MSMSLVGEIVVSLVNPIFFARFAPLLASTSLRSFSAVEGVAFS